MTIIKKAKIPFMSLTVLEVEYLIDIVKDSVPKTEIDKAMRDTFKERVLETLEEYCRERKEWLYQCVRNGELTPPFSLKKSGFCLVSAYN